MKVFVLALTLAFAGATGVLADDWELVWSDEFDKDGRPDTAVWNYERGFVRNEEDQWYQSDNVYVKDKFDLGIQEYFEEKNPAALEEMTAVMLETVRKGMWQASEQQIADISQLHTELVNKYKPSCSGFVCDNAKLRDFIASKVSPEAGRQYQANISQIREAVAENTDGVVMKKEELNPTTQQHETQVSSLWIVVAVVAVLAGLIVLMRKRRKNRM